MGILGITGIGIRLVPRRRDRVLTAAQGPESRSSGLDAGDRPLGCAEPSSGRPAALRLALGGAGGLVAPPLPGAGPGAVPGRAAGSVAGAQSPGRRAAGRTGPGAGEVPANAMDLISALSLGELALSFSRVPLFPVFDLSYFIVSIIYLKYEPGE